jgi:hypothetical protein
VTAPRKTAIGATRTTCPRCTAPCYRQLVGHRAALMVLADVAPYVTGDARTPGPWRLLWCVARLHGGVVDLRWRCPADAVCSREHVICHMCPAETRVGRRPEGARW